MGEKKTNFYINFIELKLRTIYVFYSLIFTFIICFNYKIELFFLISSSFLKFEEGFIYTSLLDPIIIYLKLSFLFTIIITLPFLGYIYGFFFLKAFSNFYLRYFIFYFILIYFTSFFLLISLSKLILPFIFEFLISFQRTEFFGGFNLILQATITQYYTLFFSYLYIFILIIAVPNLYLIFIFLGFINKDNFLSYNFRKYLYLLMTFFFLIFAPPDFLIQLVIFPIIILILEIYIYIITYLYSLYFAFFNILRREGIEPSIK